MRVEETIQQRKDRAFRYHLYLAFIILLFTILIIRAYDLQVSHGKEARAKSETYEDVVVKKSIFNDQYYSSQKNTPLQKGIKSTND
ncbi:hypothetical protein [Fictibacillus barbaricus]|jgi:hypothetical protein|uniref:Cell division protein FtsI/penicillin-binding protein 2 n=1 Tax=Fictibacillus barbaricus TaxID=182136 RepID=A0ABU1U0P3_9BACL|nr:hypothetical protein [Fictibacillus barbaricus]MDR7073017.1 cell division protein FtsI/penicillin-binding protein 2 [Fictibacillus barbaricus]